MEGVSVERATLTKSSPVWPKHSQLMTSLWTTLNTQQTCTHTVMCNNFRMVFAARGANLICKKIISILSTSIHWPWALDNRDVCRSQNDHLPCNFLNVFYCTCFGFILRFNWGCFCFAYQRKWLNNTKGKRKCNMFLSISTFCSHILHDDSCVCRENMLREYIPRFGWLYGGGCVDKLPLNLYLILATCLNVSVGCKSSQCWGAVDPHGINNTAI